jgi:23S rRNA pseudouridine1911/1915/1917 synthase
VNVIESTRLNKPQNYSLASSGAGEKPGECVPDIIPSAYAGLRLDQALAQMFPQYSRSRLQSWLREGRIRVDGRMPEPRSKVYGGERLEMEIGQPPSDDLDAAQAEDIALAIVFEDEDLLVLDKPAGLVVHPGNGNRSGTLMNALLHHAPLLASVPRAGIVHRLDKETSGLLVVAKTLPAQASLVRQLQARTVGRRYLALAHGTVIRDGEVDAPIGRHPALRTKMAVTGGGRAALTHFRVRERLGAATLLECRLETGRTHQIRVHMAHLGHPLVGDPVYGLRRVADPLLAGFSRQALHAFRLELVHPSAKETMRWFSPLPEDFFSLLCALGSRSASSMEADSD